MPNKIGRPIEQENVVGEIRGYERPDEIVILGAHLDSWELGTGALDNGCNAALVIEAARAIKATGLLPRRTIRFVLFSGEEQGTVGSFEYVKAHRAELDKIRGVIVFDAGIGRVTGYSLGGRHDTEAGVREVLKPLESWGANNHTYDASFGTDNFDFLLEGVPTLVANQEEANYLPNYHAASDTLDKVDMRELKLHTVLAAMTAWGIADRAGPLGKRLSRAELDVLVKEIVVGLPLRLDGTRGEMAEEAERFGQRVRKQIGVPVEMVDERLSSWEAERLLEEVQGRFIHEEKLTGVKKPKNAQTKMTVDAVAAAVILKEYLDRQEQTAGKT